MYADAGLFLVPVLQSDRVPPAVSAARFLEALARGTRKVSTSTLTWDEVVYVVRRLLGPEDSVAKGAELLAFPNLTWHRVPHGVARRSGPLPVLADATEGCDPCRDCVGSGGRRNSLRGPSIRPSSGAASR